MPEIKFKHVVSCSSEDTQFAADNLLATESFKKWKCKPGEKQAVVILQFDHSTSVQSIDIGNDGSAFVEVLVGRSADKDDNYEVLLVSQSFLSPAESRQESNTNRVRIFNKDQMEKMITDQKWDRLKVVCSQPYNKNIGYGLSFIRVHAPAGSAKAGANVEKQSSIEIVLGCPPGQSDLGNGACCTKTTLAISNCSVAVVPWVLDGSVCGPNVNTLAIYLCCPQVNWTALISIFPTPTTWFIIYNNCKIGCLNLPPKGISVVCQDDYGDCNICLTTVNPTTTSQSYGPTVQPLVLKKSSVGLITGVSCVVGLSLVFTIAIVIRRVRRGRGSTVTLPQRIDEPVQLESYHNSVETAFGKFLVKSDDETGGGKSDFTPGAMFKQRSRLEQEPAAPSVASTIKGAADEYVNKHEHQKKMAGNSSTSAKPAKQDSSVGKHKEQEKKKRSPSPSTARRNKSKSPEHNNKKTENPPAKASTAEKSKKSTKSPKYVDFDKLLDGVVFVLSGFENPGRGQLRDKAVQMGAQYKADWAKGCTHLVCAFTNTPKYNQVRGKGKIVKKDWILDCHKQRKRLYWKKYGFEKPKDSEESEEELIASPEGSATSTKPKHPDSKEPVSSDIPKQSKSPPAKKAKNESGVYDASTDEIDTDDEIERVRAKNAARTHGESESKKPAEYESKKQAESESKKQAESESKLENSKNAKNDIDSVVPAEKSNKHDDIDDLPELPCFFQNFRFLLNGEFSPAEKKQLNRYIVAFDGKIEQYMSSTVSHVLTHDTWTSDFDEALKENGKLIFVKPEWVLECGRKNFSVDINKYLIKKH